MAIASSWKMAAKPATDQASSLAADLALALNPRLLLEAGGLECDPWQARLLLSTSTRVLLNCHRQAGKSTVGAALAIHTALYQPESLVLLLSPTLRQSQELFHKGLAFYQALRKPVEPDAESALRIELRNGSRIVSLPGNEANIRGYSGVSLLIIDEAARVPDELYYAVRPMLAVSGGRLLALSTPFGTRGWWYEAWHSTDDWERYEVPATENPRIPPEFLEEERRTLGEWWYKQEYECSFSAGRTQAFNREDIERAFSELVTTWAL